MSPLVRNRARAVAVAAAPLVLLLGALTHPFLGNLPGTADLVRAVNTQPTRWAIGHVLLGLGIAFMLLLFFAVRTYLHERGEIRWSFWAIPFVTIGLGLVGFMVGAEGIGGRAAVATGNVEAFFEELEAWALPIYLVANLLLAIGLFSFAAAVSKSRVLAPGLSRLSVTGAVVAAVGLFLPVGWAAHVVSVGAILFGWPLASALWRREEPEEDASRRLAPSERAA